MNDTIADIFIHTDDQLDDARYAELCEAIYKKPGIVSLSRNVHTPRFLVVVYNAAVTRSREILENIKAQGVEAKLVGF